MKILKHLTANDIQLTPFPFLRELSMEAYIIENEGVLCLEDENFSSVEIVEAELSIKGGRSSKDTDGRIDILALYSEEHIGIIELKLGELNKSHLEQLEEYLEKKDEVLKKYGDALPNDTQTAPKWVGILVGSSIDSDLARRVRMGYKAKNDIPIAALTIQRFRGSDGQIYVVTDTYSGIKVDSKHRGKYIFNEETYPKGRLVFAVIKHHINKQPNLKYSDLEASFPRKCQADLGATRLKKTNSVFDRIEVAQKIYTETTYKRHFLKPEELVKLADCTIAVSNQWGKDNISSFIECAKKIGYKIKPA